MPKYMGESDILTDPGRSRYDEGMRNFIEVHTNKRSYSWLGPGQVTWMKGEKVISMEPKSCD